MYAVTVNPHDESWRELARGEIEAEAAARKAKERERTNALIEKAARANTPVGQYLRTRNSRRLHRQGREKMYISLTLGMAQQLRAEADDCRISFSNLISSLISIAYPIWQEYRREFITGEIEQTYIPMRVKSIFVQATNHAVPRSPAAWNSWHSQVEKNIMESRKPKREKKQDPTDAVLRGLGGGLKKSELP